MRHHLLLTALFLVVLGFSSAADAQTATKHPYVWAKPPAGQMRAAPVEQPVMTAYDARGAYEQPDLIALGVGYFDVFENHPRNEAVDFRLEYRSGLSLLPVVSSYFSSWDPYFQIRPQIGLEATTDGALYANGGFLMEFLIGRNIGIGINEAVGFYERGDGKRLGSFVEFRSTAELSYIFDNGARITAAIGHISNAGLTKLNPGAEIATVYAQIPVDWIFSR